MNTIISFLVGKIQKFICLILAVVMLFNLSAQSFAQVASYPKKNAALSKKTPQEMTEAELLSFDSEFDRKELRRSQEQMIVAKQDNLRVYNAQAQLVLNRQYQAQQDEAKINYLPFKEVRTAVIKALAKEGIHPKDITEETFTFFYNLHKKEVKEEDDAVTAVFNKLSYNDKKSYGFFNDHYSAVKAKYNEADPTAKVCIDKACYPTYIYMRGVLRFLLNKGAFGGTKTWDTENMLKDMSDINWIAENFGAQYRDQEFLENYIEKLIDNVSKHCDNDLFRSDILGPSIAGGGQANKSASALSKQQRQTECSKIGASLSTYVMFNTGFRKESKESKIYSAMKKVYRKDHGSIIVANGIAVLAHINSTLSFGYIERFLTQDSIPSGSFREEMGKVLDLLSLDAYSQKGIDAANAIRNGNGRYLNNVSAAYQYISSETRDKFGIINLERLALADLIPSLDPNIPFNNVFEDIGEMLGQMDSANAAKTTQAILSKYISAHEKRVECLAQNTASGLVTPITGIINSSYVCNAGYKTHSPLVAGILKTKQGNTAAGKKAAAIFYKGDWWDISEATQRRINNIGAAKINGVQKTTVDAAKKTRYLQNKKIILLGSYTDMLVSAIFIGLLIASIPSMVRSLANLGRNLSRINTISKAGKANLLKTIRTNIKASGVKPAEIKTAIAQRQANISIEANAAKIRQQRGINLDAAGKPLAKQAAPKTAPKAAATPKNGEIEITLVDKTKAQNSITAKYKANGKFVSSKRTAGPDAKPGQLQTQNTNLTTHTGGANGGGINSKAPLTDAQKTLAQQRAVADKAAANIKYDAEIAADKAASFNAAQNYSFKPTLIRNKPYNQLSPWRKWVADFQINTAYKMDLVRGTVKNLAKNPAQTLMMSSLPLGTTAEAIKAPIGIYASVGTQATTFSSVSNITRAAETINTLSYSATAANALKTPSLLPVISMPQAVLSATTAPVSLAKLWAVRHEWQGGPSGGNYKVISGGNYSLPAAPAGVENASLLPVPLSYYDNKLPEFKAATPATAAASAALPADWALQTTAPKSNSLNNTHSLVAEIPQLSELPTTTYADPLAAASLAIIPLFARLGKNQSNGIQTSQKAADTFSKIVLSKTSPLPSDLAKIVRSQAADYYKQEALLKLFKAGLLNASVQKLNPETKKLIEGDYTTVEEADRIKDGLLKIYKVNLFNESLDDVKDINIPKQRRFTPVQRQIIEERKDVVYNENDQVEASLLDWGTGAIPFEKPSTNAEMIAGALKPMEYIIKNADKGIQKSDGVLYKNNIPVYYRDKDGNLSEHPRILLSYTQRVSAWTNFLARFKLATKKGVLIPNGLVLALDEEGKAKLVMPRGNLHVVEADKTAKKIALENKETNRVSIDSEFTSSDLIEIAAILQGNPETAFEIELNKPDSFNAFLNLHALFIGNDAGNTLAGQFKSYAEAAGGNSVVNSIGGVGYATPFIGGALMGWLTKLGHINTIRMVYGIVLGALTFSMFPWAFGFGDRPVYGDNIKTFAINVLNSGMLGIYKFPDSPSAHDFIFLAIPTTLMVLGGSILNTTIQTLLNIYKDPVSRTTAHLQYANNKNYSRLAVSAITGLALVSGLGLNWSIVVPAAAALLLVAGTLLFNTRIYDNYLKDKTKRKQAKKETNTEAAKLTPEEIKQRMAAMSSAAKTEKEFANKFHKIYKKELNKKPEMKDISKRVSKLYASYAASLLVLTQSFQLVSSGMPKLPGHALSIGFASIAAAALLYAYLKKPAEEATASVKKFKWPLIFFVTTMATIFFASDAAQSVKAFTAGLTTLALLTTTMVRVLSTDLIKNKVATDDQLSGLSLPLIAVMTSLLAFAPSSGVGLIASLAMVLFLYAGTAVPGQLDSARMQNFITSEYKAKKNELNNQNLSTEDLQKAMSELSKEEKYMSSKGAAKFSYLNGAGIIGIGVAVLGALFMQDILNNPPSWLPEVFVSWQNGVLDLVSSLSLTPGQEAHSIAFNRLVLIYAAIVAWILVAQNMHLVKAGVGLFHKQQITQDNIDAGKITPKSFDINEKNAGIKLSALDKEIKDINGIVFKHGKSSEVKMTEILNKLFQINNRLAAISQFRSHEEVAKSLEQLKYITANLEGMIENNDLSFAYKQQFEKLKGALTKDNGMSYVEEGVYALPKSLQNYENGIMLVRELSQLSEDIKEGNVNSETYKHFSTYYARAVQELTQYANDNRIDAERAHKYLKEINKIGTELMKIDHSKNTVAPPSDIIELQEVIKLLHNLNSK